MRAPTDPGPGTSFGPCRTWVQALILVLATLSAGLVVTGWVQAGPSGQPIHVAASTSSCSPPTTCLLVSFNLSQPHGGAIFVSAIAGSPILQNETLSIPAGTFSLTADPSSGFTFQGWSTDGEIQVQDPASAQTNVTVTSSPSTVEAHFSPIAPAPASSILDMPWMWGLVGVVATSVVAVVLFRWRKRPESAPKDEKAETVSPKPQVSEEANVLAGWERSALTAWEGASEDELWTSVHESKFPAAHLLCFTFGRPERLAKRYGLVGATAVRIARVEGAPGALQLAPTELDAMIDLIEKHLKDAEGRGVVIPNLEALILANDIRTVVRLIEVSRDLALDRKGSVLFTVNTAAVTVANLALLERGARRRGA